MGEFNPNGSLEPVQMQSDHWSDCLLSCRKRSGLRRERTIGKDIDKQTKDDRKRCYQYKMIDKQTNDRLEFNGEQ